MKIRLKLKNKLKAHDGDLSKKIVMTTGDAYDFEEGIMLYNSIEDAVIDANKIHNLDITVEDLEESDSGYYIEDEDGDFLVNFVEVEHDYSTGENKVLYYNTWGSSYVFDEGDHINYVEELEIEEDPDWNDDEAGIFVISK